MTCTRPGIHHPAGWAVQATSGAALAEATMWGPPQPQLMLEQGLAVYKTRLEMLTELKPDVILTQLQVGPAARPLQCS